MRIHRVTLAGWKAFPTTVSVDISALPGRITAVSGDNGAGKSTFCALAVLGALYRKIPGYLPGGHLPNEIAAARDAHVEVDVELADAERLTIRQHFDPRGGGSVLVEDAPQHPIDEVRSGGIKEYGAWRAKRLPDYEVVAAGSYLAQGDGGLLAMGNTDRGRVILRAMGADRVAQEAKVTREFARAAAADLGAIVARLADERERSGDVAVTGAALSEAQEALASAAAAVGAARGAMVDAEAWEAAVVRLDGAQARVDALAERLRAPRSLVARACQIRADARLAEEADADIARVALEEQDAARALATSEDALCRAMGEADTVRGRHEAARSEASALRARYEAAFAKASARETEARRREDAAQGLLADRDAILAAVARVAELDHAIADMQVQATLDAGAVGAAEAEMRATRLATLAQEEAHATARRSLAAAERQLATLANVEQAIADLPSARETLARATERVQAAGAAVAALQDDDRTLVDRRRALAWRVIVEILAHPTPTTTDDAAVAYHAARAAAQRATEEDDRLVADAAGLPARLAAARVESGDATLAQGEARQREARLADLAALGDDLAAAKRARDQALATLALPVVADDAPAARHRAALAQQATTQDALNGLVAERRALAPRAAMAHGLAAAGVALEQARADAAQASEEVTAASHDLAAVDEREEMVRAAVLREQPAAERAVQEAREAVSAASERLDGLRRNLQARRGCRAALADAGEALAALDRAEATLTALADDEADAVTALAEAHAALAALPKATTFAAAQDAHRAALAAQEGAAAALVRAEEAHARATAGAARVAALEAERVRVEVDLAEWRELAEDLGRRGLQADLVDQAAPILTRRANELLRAADVLRWTMRFTTETADGDGDTVPGFPLLVRDEQTGEERDARCFSGGEKALLGAAAADAVAVLACDRAGIVAPLLVRDETGGVLSPGNERAWIAMLRRTVEMTGASRVFVVSHSPSLRAMCDGVIEVGGGRVVVGDVG